MIRVFRLINDYSRLQTVDMLIYSISGLLAVLLVGILMERHLAGPVDNNRKRRVFLLSVGILSILSVFFLPQTGSWRAHQYESQGMDFILNMMLTNWDHKYLAGVLVAAVLLSIFSTQVGLNRARVLDAFALSLPLGLILIQCAFLVTGETWGRHLSLRSIGLGRMVSNPIPVYAIAVNISLFFFLKRIRGFTHVDHTTQNRYEGLAFGLFSLLYGVSFLLLEYYGKGLKVLFKLTLTQYVMFGFILTGIFVLAWVLYRKNEEPAGKAPSVDTGIQRLLYLAGFVALTFALIFIVYYLIKHMRLISWPFRTTRSVAEAYERILEYLPMMALPAIAFFWMIKSRMDIRDAFRWKRVTWWFYPVLFASTAYGMYKLFGRTPLKGWAYLPPALILCAMNAFSEEFSYRFVFFRLLRQANYSGLVCHLAQSLLYALPHFILAGFVFGSMSFMYGLLMGVLADKNDSITPAVICHFIIDLGLIGNPLMRS